MVVAVGSNAPGIHMLWWCQAFPGRTWRSGTSYCEATSWNSDHEDDYDSLRLQLAAMVDVGRHLVNIPYKLEGDDALVFSTYQVLQSVTQAFAQEHWPNVRALCEAISDADPDVNARQLERDTMQGARPAINWFLRKFNVDLGYVVTLFRVPATLIPWLCKTSTWLLRMWEAFVPFRSWIRIAPLKLCRLSCQPISLLLVVLTSLKTTKRSVGGLYVRMTFLHGLMRSGRCFSSSRLLQPPSELSVCWLAASLPPSRVPWRLCGVISNASLQQSRLQVTDDASLRL